MGAAFSRALRLTGGAFGLAAVVALGLLSAPPTAHATTFNPQMDVSLSHPSPGVATDIVFNFSLEAPDSSFESIVSFIPPGFFIAPDDDVPAGAWGGVLNATPTIGQINNPCSTRVPANFNLLREPQDISYPYFLERIAPGAEPRAVYGGHTWVAGAETTVSLIVFEPGTVFPRFPAFDASLGYPTMFFINDPTRPAGVLQISDICSPIESTLTLYGTSRDNPVTHEGGGHVLLRAPAGAGQYNSVTFIRSLWDADNDGIENPLDVCALIPNPGWNPHTNDGDADNDALPDDCDPSTTHIADEDGDGYLNRQDNCPTIAGFGDRDYDLIGDACDPFPTDPSNDGVAHRHQLCRFGTFTIGSGGPVTPTPECPSGPDLPTLFLLDVLPLDTVRAVSNVHTIRMTVRDPGSYEYGGVPGVNIEIDVTGANPASGSCVTQQYQDCEFSYLGLNAGTDTIVVTADAPNQSLTKTFTVSWLMPPANDLFVNAEDITLFPASFTAAIPAASAPSGEPNDCEYVSRTVWYDLTSDTDRYIRIEAAAEGMYAYLALYTNQAVGGFRAVACGYNYYEESEDAGESYLFAHLPAGQTLHLQVSGGAFGQLMPTDLVVEIEDAVEGDAECDDDWDIDDIMALLLVLGDEEPIDCYGAGDWDCNGYPSARDVTEALAHMAGVGPALADCPWNYYSGPFD